MNVIVKTNEAISMNTSPGLRTQLELDLGFTCRDSSSDAWQKALIARINELILHDFPKLVALLYRLDVSEPKLKQKLKDHADADAGKVIADLMIERQAEKIKTREQFRRNDAGLDENEKW